MYVSSQNQLSLATKTTYLVLQNKSKQIGIWCCLHFTQIMHNLLTNTQNIIRIVNKMTVDNQQNKHCHWSRPLLNIGMVMVSRMFYFQFFSTKMWVYYYWSTSVRLVRHLSRGTKLFFWYSSRNWTRECFSPLNLCTWCTQLTVVWVLLEFVQACLNKLNGFKTYSSWSATAKAIH